MRAFARSSPSLTRLLAGETTFLEQALVGGTLCECHTSVPTGTVCCARVGGVGVARRLSNVRARRCLVRFCALTSCLFVRSWATWTCWFLSASLKARALPITFAGDVYLVLQLLWASFLPLGHSLSIDAWWRRRQRSANDSDDIVDDDDDDQDVCNVATFAFTMQICIVYGMCARRRVVF